MFEEFINADVPLAGAGMLLWGIAAAVVRGASGARLVRTLRLRVRIAQVLIVLGCVPIIGRLVTASGLVSLGWDFGSDRVVLFWPMFAAGLAAVLLFTWRPLAAARRAVANRDRERPVSSGVRHLLGRRSVGLGPVFLAVTGALGVVANLVIVPVPPLTDDALGYWLAALILTLILTPGARESALNRRILVGGVRAVAAASAIGLVATSVIGVHRSSFLPGSYDMAAHGPGGHGSHEVAAADHSGPTDHSGHAGHAGHAGGAGQGAAGHFGPDPVAPDAAGADQAGETGKAGKTRQITELTGPRNGKPDVRIELRAEQKRITLPGGTEVDAWTFNGTLPGPAIRAQRNDLVEIVLTNHDIAAGATVHLHGVDVPNAEDGVPGMTQDAVPPGGQHVYRFRAEQVGTFWYHSHQASSEQVRRGLYGTLVVTDRKPERDVQDIGVTAHRIPTADGSGTGGQVLLTNGTDGRETRVVAPGQKVRLRLAIADNLSQVLFLNGTRYRVTGVDGNDIHRPQEIERQALYIGGGGRRTVEFTMPDQAVTVSDKRDPNFGMTLLPREGAPVPEADLTHPELDLLTYGEQTSPVRLDPKGYQVTKTYFLDNQTGWFDGQFGMLWMMNGKVAPDIDPVVVNEGDEVMIRYVNRSRTDHPMHLHGHQVRILSIDGQPSTGSPIWVDTAAIMPGKEMVIAFKANNPGLWMDHCHNLNHAKIGMVNHLVYRGWSTPFRAGRDTPNHPE